MTQEVQARSHADTFLDLSNSHVSRDTADWLDVQGLVAATFAKGSDPTPELTLGRTTRGWFIYVPTMDAIEQRSAPDDLKIVLRYAREQNFAYLLLDQDADTIDSLIRPTEGSGWNVNGVMAWTKSTRLLILRSQVRDLPRQPIF